MKTEDVIAVYGSVQAVRFLWNPPLSRSAIYQWPEEVPALRQYQLREMQPDIDARIAALPKKRRNGHQKAA